MLSETKFMTTIPLYSDTMRKLEKYGYKNETWDELVKRLMEELEECRKNTT